MLYDGNWCCRAEVRGQRSKVKVTHVNKLGHAITYKQRKKTKNKHMYIHAFVRTHTVVKWNTTPHHTTPHYTTLHHTTLYHTTLHHTTLHSTTPHHTTPHHTTPHHNHTALHYTTLQCALDSLVGQMTPASSLCPQLWARSSLLLHSSRECSPPVHTTSSRTMGPEPEQCNRTEGNNQ